MRKVSYSRHSASAFSSSFSHGSASAADAVKRAAMPIKEALTNVAMFRMSAGVARGGPGRGGLSGRLLTAPWRPVDNSTQQVRTASHAVAANGGSLAKQR